MMDPTIQTAIITAIVTLIAGGGGILTYLGVRQKNQQEGKASSVLEWKELYETMREGFEEQKKDNEKLQEEVAELRRETLNLQLQLTTYKHSDLYAKELDAYVDSLLAVVRPLVNEEAYKELCNKRPRHYMIKSPGAE